MTPFLAWVKKTAEKLFGRWNEGPDPPPRLRQMVLHFAHHHPRATRAEWTEFAAGLAEEAWRSAWVRGFEHVERSPDWRPDVPPEVLADWIDGDQNRTWIEDPIHLEGPTVVVSQDAEPETDLLRRQMNEQLLAASRGR